MSLNYDDIVKDTDAIVRTKSEPVTPVSYTHLTLPTILRV